MTIRASKSEKTGIKKLRSIIIGFLVSGKDTEGMESYLPGVYEQKRSVTLCDAFFSRHKIFVLSQFLIQYLKNPKSYKPVMSGIIRRYIFLVHFSENSIQC